MPELHNKMELLSEDRTLSEAAREPCLQIILLTFWAEAVSTACYVLKKTENLVTQAGAAKSSSTNIFSTVSTTAKASGTNLVNTVSIPVSTASTNKGLSLSDITNSQRKKSLKEPLHEDIPEDTTDGIFTTIHRMDDEGAEADFSKLGNVVNVSPIPTFKN
ncbi:hypothetical protein Tco_1057288 [Tanacetum coccineum]|uniref:Uncharacterized protein n=1 Tax=Tanacetum coccineum TaxID=301880 RepID=A0ABQ5H5X4_9ASTR